MSQEELKKAADRRVAQNAKDLRAVLALEGGAGVRYLTEILSRGGIFKAVVNSNHRVAALEEGKRMLALSVFKDIREVAPEVIYRLFEPERAEHGGRTIDGRKQRGSDTGEGV